MVALLPVEGDVLVAEALEPLEREFVVGALRFLQTKNVRPDGFDEFGDVIDPQPHRIDVPGRDGKAHLVAVRARGWSSWSGRGTLLSRSSTPSLPHEKTLIRGAADKFTQSAQA